LEKIFFASEPNELTAGEVGGIHQLLTAIHDIFKQKAAQSDKESLEKAHNAIRAANFSKVPLDYANWNNQH
jgi:hypothetical protein